MVLLMVVLVAVAAAAAAASLFKRSVFLSYLNLSGCNIKTKSAEILNIALPKSKLRTLIMHRAGMKNPKTFGLIASGCADSNSLSSVSFKSNGMSAKSIQHIQVRIVRHRLPRPTSPSFALLALMARLLRGYSIGQVRLPPTAAGPAVPCRCC